MPTITAKQKQTKNYFIDFYDFISFHRGLTNGRRWREAGGARFLSPHLIKTEAKQTST